jgi:hypothetical protein
MSELNEKPTHQEDMYCDDGAFRVIRAEWVQDCIAAEK